ncbi:glycosyltransferase [Pilimelia columellifera]|uniref:Glycosyltransferase 2-like domain-containing protein n=1 Tax=Pilimelia columellifera subsp. columellifera TaxID=706583 RepID=A0ABN3N859_9ACTN
MSRAPVSVVLLASGTPNDLRLCLESLRPTLGVRDEVIAVVPPGSAGSAPALRREAWITVLDSPTDDPGESWSQGVAVSRRPLVALLDGDVLCSARWLDTVADALADPAVVAAGPACYRSGGPQGVEIGAGGLRSAAAFKSYARQWRQDHRGAAVDVDRLGPVCALIRREALDRHGVPPLGGAYDAIAADGRVVLVEQALLAHTGGPACALRRDTRPGEVLISASLIVKDEERVLGASLTAVRDLVDEVVVYDTGSTDNTREIAREHGARVIEGYWNDHFGDARNRGIEQCRGEWVLIVDADEVAEGDPDQLRALFAQARDSSFLTMVYNAKEAGGNALWSTRVFRRDQCRYRGRLHEQVTDRITGDGVVGPRIPAPVLSIAHSGYTSARMAIKNKSARNLDLARIAATGPAPMTAFLDLARSELQAGNLDEAVDACRRGLEAGSHRVPRLVMMTILVRALAEAGRLEEARQALAELRATDAAEVTVAPAEIRLLIAEGRHEEALTLIRQFPERATDDMLLVVGRSQLANLEIYSLVGLGRTREAAEILRERLRVGELPLSLSTSGRILGSMRPIAELFPTAQLRTLLGSAVAEPAEPAALVDELADELWRRHEGHPVPLALGGFVGPALSPARALEWSARLRAHGHRSECPLLRLAADEQRTPRERVQAAAIALTTFEDETALPRLEAALAMVPAAEHDAVIADLRLLAPQVAAALEPAGA